MIEIRDEYFGWGGWPWLVNDDFEGTDVILEQLYAQMMGWA